VKPEHVHPDWSEDGEDRLRRIIRAEMNARRKEEGLDGYHEFPVSLIKWVAGGVMALTVVGITGLVVMYGQIQALTTSVNDLRHEVERGNPKTVYRGASDESGTH